MSLMALFARTCIDSAGCSKPLHTSRKASINSPSLISPSRRSLFNTATAIKKANLSGGSEIEKSFFLAQDTNSGTVWVKSLIVHP